MKTFYIVRLQDGQYIGNRISGPGNLNSFVPCDKADAVRFYREHNADAAIVGYKLKGATIETMTEKP